MSDVKYDYASFITTHRIASGFKTQKDFAEAIGISRATVSRMEDGKHRPAPETIQAMAKKLPTTSLTELMVVCGYWDEEELLEPIKTEVKYKSNLNLVKETPSQSYSTEKEFLADMELLNKIKLLTEEFDMDLHDPETLETLKDALNLIKRVRGE